jgi:putative nucleotidyltransferase with HDIG domain
VGKCRPADIRALWWLPASQGDASRTPALWPAPGGLAECAGMSRRSTALLTGEAALLAAALAVAALTSTRDDWRPPGLVVVLLGLALATDLFAVSHEGQRISGSFLALVLAMALLGPAPAVAIGVASVLVDHVRARNPPARLLTNLATFATFPLIGALIVRWADVAPRDSAFPVLVFAVFLVTNLINFVMIAGDHAVHERVSPVRDFRAIFLPVLPSEVISALLCALVAAIYVRTGVPAMTLMVVVLVVFQYLLRALLLSRERAARLAALQLGVLVSMIETLALRDRMTARHSAAVARYAAAMADALDWPSGHRELVHTAGLLHDVGKFAFPDSILLADQKLTPEQREAVKAHPADGARLLRRLDGYGPVADVVLSHHERWDGLGYPRGLAGEAIPAAARVIAVADTYDVLTARDSYRKPVSAADAVAELRRVAGGQLDPELVEVFADLVTRGALSFGHGDDVDFEHELGFERLVRAHALPGTG